MTSLLAEQGLVQWLEANMPNATIDQNGYLTAFRVTGISRLSLSDKPLIQAKHLQSLKQLWQYLKDLYSPKGFSSEFLLFKELFSTSLINSNGDMEGFLSEVSRISSDLAIKGL